jgi:hypothetical protein
MENISGIIKIEYAQREHVASVRINPATSCVEEFIFAPGHNWLNFYFTPQTAGIDVATGLSDPGTVYTCQVTAKVPKNSPETSSFIRASQSCWFLLRVTDGNGIIHLVGTPDFPAQFIARKIAVPQSTAGYNGYDVGFTSRQLTPPAYFNK